jgi:histidine triad (HIT) family protein
MSGCIFCQIVNGEAPGRIVHRDALVTAFHDRRPISALHLLIVPNEHIASLNELDESHSALAAHLLFTAQRLAAQMGVAEKGYRLVMNTGRDGGQSVAHLHLHLIAGRLAGWHLG